MDIIKAGAADLPELATLNMEVQKIHVAAHPDVFKDLSQKAIENWFRELLQDANCRLFIGRDGGQAIGYMVLELKDEPENPFQERKKFLYIDQISVKQEHRRRGFGEKFFQFAKDYARLHGFKRIILDVWSFNEGAKRFFAAQGFRTWIERMEMSP